MCCGGPVCFTTIAQNYAPGILALIFAWFMARLNYFKPSLKSTVSTSTSTSPLESGTACCEGKTSTDQDSCCDSDGSETVVEHEHEHNDHSSHSHDLRKRKTVVHSH